jgi:hypothetical protein
MCPMSPTERHRAASRDTAQSRLTWLTAGTAAIALVGTGGFAVAAAVTYAGTPQSATAQGPDAQGGPGTDPFAGQADGQGPSDQQATAAPDAGGVFVPAPVTTTRHHHASSGGSH